jgi:hypothetical protein
MISTDSPLIDNRLAESFVSQALNNDLKSKNKRHRRRHHNDKNYLPRVQPYSPFTPNPGYISDNSPHLTADGIRSDLTPGTSGIHEASDILRTNSNNLNHLRAPLSDRRRFNHNVSGDDVHHHNDDLLSLTHRSASQIQTDTTAV